MSCGLEFLSTEVSAAPPKVIAHVTPNELYFLKGQLAVIFHYSAAYKCACPVFNFELLIRFYETWYERRAITGFYNIIIVNFTQSLIATL
jgi:hypothetical protein